ncbi:MAG: hypothetical protein QOH70_847 [Blastocatellia bacterium]|jgi:hypothetical protein|nr:hypothetical protein [Blastocatellia bacterium]
MSEPEIGRKGFLKAFVVNIHFTIQGVSHGVGDA